MQFHVVELYLYQICLLNRYGGPDATRPVSWSPWRVEILCAGLISAKSLLGLYLSFPLRAELAFNNSELIQLGFALTVGSKLAIAATEKTLCRETMSLRRSLDMSSILKQCVLRMGALTTSHVDAQGDRDVFYSYEQHVKRIQGWFEKHFLADPVGLVEHGNDNGRSVQNLQPSDNLFDVSTDVSNTNQLSLTDGMYEFQSAPFFPDAAADEITGDWILNSEMPF